jgi:hypothetical protein
VPNAQEQEGVGLIENTCSPAGAVYFQQPGYEKQHGNRIQKESPDTPSMVWHPKRFHHRLTSKALRSAALYETDFHSGR